MSKPHSIIHINLEGNTFYTAHIKEWDKIQRAFIAYKTSNKDHTISVLSTMDEVGQPLLIDLNLVESIAKLDPDMEKESRRIGHEFREYVNPESEGWKES